MKIGTRVRQLRDGKPIGRVLIIQGPSPVAGLWECRPEDSPLSVEIVLLKADQIFKV